MKPSTTHCSAPNETTSRPTGRQKAARHWSSLAGNVLATGVIFIAGMSFGRQVIVWWGSNTPRGIDRPAIVHDSTLLSSPSVPHDLQFGDVPFLLQRIPFAGVKSQAMAQLRTACRQAAAKQTAAHVAGSAEKRMLSQLDGHTPVAMQEGQWEVYELDGPVPLAVGVRFDGADHSVGSRRVVCWGLAVPLSGGENANRWTLFMWAGESQSVDSAVINQFPMPPGARRTMSMRSADGATLLSMRGAGKPADWVKHFQSWQRESSFVEDTPWHLSGTSWHARYGDENQGWLDMRIWQGQPHSVSGIVSYTPAEFHR